MSTMVDRIALALAESVDDGLHWYEYKEQALTALEAMQAPTPSMTASISMNINADQVWRTMIQAALKEEGQ